MEHRSKPCYTQCYTRALNPRQNPRSTPCNEQWIVAVYPRCAILPSLSRMSPCSSMNTLTRGVHFVRGANGSGNFTRALVWGLIIQGRGRSCLPTRL